MENLSATVKGKTAGRKREVFKMAQRVFLWEQEVVRK